MVYKREFEYEEETYLMEFDKGGYNFVLDEPLFVEVLPGRVRGQVKQPIDWAVPRYDREVQAYVMPDGSWVSVDRYGTLTPRVKPFDFDAPLEAPQLTDDTLVTDGDPTLVPTADPTAPSPVSEPDLPAQSSTATPLNTAAAPVPAIPTEATP